MYRHATANAKGVLSDTCGGPCVNEARGYQFLVYAGAPTDLKSFGMAWNGYVVSQNGWLLTGVIVVARLPCVRMYTTSATKIPEMFGFGSVLLWLHAHRAYACTPPMPTIRWQSLQSRERFWGHLRPFI